MSLEWAIKELECAHAEKGENMHLVISAIESVLVDVLQGTEGSDEK